MKPIWYFVGLLLLVMGSLLLISGLYQLIRPPSHPPVLAELHPAVWWGALLMAAGLIFLLTTRRGRVE